MPESTQILSYNSEYSLSSSLFSNTPVLVDGYCAEQSILGNPIGWALDIYMDKCL